VIAVCINFVYNVGMELILDADVKAVVEFMQSSVSATHLVEVAKAVNALAPTLWGQYQPEPIQALRLVNAPLTT
jgi:hypothetical protein